MLGLQSCMAFAQGLPYEGSGSSECRRAPVAGVATLDPGISAIMVKLFAWAGLSRPRKAPSPSNAPGFAELKTWL